MQAQHRSKSMTSTGSVATHSFGSVPSEKNETVTMSLGCRCMFMSSPPTSPSAASARAAGSARSRGDANLMP